MIGSGGGGSGYFRESAATTRSTKAINDIGR